MKKIIISLLGLAIINIANAVEYNQECQASYKGRGLNYVGFISPSPHQDGINGLQGQIVCAYGPDDFYVATFSGSVTQPGNFKSLGFEHYWMCSNSDPANCEFNIY